MRKIKRIKGAAESRLIAAFGFLGIKVHPKRLLKVLARQYEEIPSLEAFKHLLNILNSLPSKQKNVLLIPDDMYKAFSFVKRHLGNPELIRLSECHDSQKNPNIFLLKKDFLFQAHHILKNCKTTLFEHFDNPVWLILSDGVIPGGEPYTAEDLEAACSDALQATVHGFGDTVFSVRPGTNDYQIVNEVASSYLPDIKNWLGNSGSNALLRIIDLGGHIGSFSIQVNALLSKKCEIHIYEPEPSNYAQIEKNISLNHDDNITPFNLAVSSVAGQNTLYFNPEHSGAHQLGSGLSYETKAIPLK